MQDTIKKLLAESANVKKKVSETMTAEIEECAQRIIHAHKNGCKVVFCGNGGSAADAQHLATELIHQFEIKRRKAFPALTITTDTSTLTAIGNDWGFDEIFSRQVEGIVKKGDILIGLTTSGNSSNIVKAVEQAKKQEAFTIAFTGNKGGRIKDIVDLALIVPSESTARIQEAHITIGHIICKLVEDAGE